MGNLKTMVNETKALDAALTIGSAVLLSHAGSKRPATIVQINKDRTKVQVSTGSGRPLWFNAECALPAAPAKASASNAAPNVATQAKAPKSVKSAKNAPAKKAATPSAAEKAAKTIVKAKREQQAASEQPQKPKVKMTAKQSEFFTLVKKASAKISARELADAMNLTKLEVVKIGVTLMTSKLVDGNLVQGESEYTISKAGKALNLADIETEKTKKKRGAKTQMVIDLINEGLTSKQITDRVGCDASHVSHIRSMLFIQQENAKPENAKLTNEQFSEKTGKTMYLVNLFRK